MASKDVSIWVRVKDGFSAGLTRASGKLKKLGRTMKAVGTSFAAAGVIIVGSLVKTLSMVNKFDKGMARVEAPMGGQKQSGLRREITALAGEFGIATDQLVNGLYNALSAGVPKDNVIEFLRIGAKAAVADGSDISVSIDGITTVLNAFKLSADKASKVAF